MTPVIWNARSTSQRRRLSPASLTMRRAQSPRETDEAGETVQMVKTTYAPDGKIVHIKDKF